MSGSSKVDVYYTVDTEIWWSAADLSRFDDDFQRYFHGRTASGTHGTGYQLDLLDQHGLKGVFFVEPLFACAVGLDPLKEMVALIQGRGHDVQLHLHTEWLPRIEAGGGARLIESGRTGEHIHCFSEDEQVRLFEIALEKLAQAGAENVCAYRAGNFGASLETLRALRRVGIKYDSSYNGCYLDGACRMSGPHDGQASRPLVHPGWLEGVVELPVSHFSDYPGHRRHVQVRAISFGEIKHVLLQAHREHWPAVVIVSHSFELLSSDRSRPDPIVIRRFRRLCEFLGRNADKFRSATFDGSYEPPACGKRALLKGRLRDTAWRLGEQLARRLLIDRR